jgi:hypothetical protein
MYNQYGILYALEHRNTIFANQVWARDFELRILDFVKRKTAERNQILRPEAIKQIAENRNQASLRLRA